MAHDHDPDQHPAKRLKTAAFEEQQREEQQHRQDRREEKEKEAEQKNEAEEGEVKEEEVDEETVDEEEEQQQQEEDSTDFKMAILASLHPDKSANVHLDYLLAYGGNTERASAALSGHQTANEPAKQKKPSTIGYQSSLHSFASHNAAASRKATTSATPAAVRLLSKPLTKKGKTLHLYAPKDIEAHTPCTIVHNFLPSEQADALLLELLEEAPSFERGTFQLFERTVQTPHTWRFYLDTEEAIKEQQTDFVYAGSVYESTALKRTTPEMLKVSGIVKRRVNEEIQRRIRKYHPEAQKLKFQSPEAWEPNASFVNCYDGGKESVGYHSDQLTYLGPRAVIGSLSLGVSREFRVRRIVPQTDAAAADEQGQIAIHLPHNSLLVMHADMQEEWKHSIAPAQTIDPHPLAKNKRLNVTYRCYKDYLHPKFTPRCKCNVACVLRCVQKRAATRGRYMWQCYANYQPGHNGCAHFEWADFDKDGKPPWYEGYKGNANLPLSALEDDGG